MQICTRHKDELEAQLEKVNLVQFKSKTPEELERKLAIKTINAASFDPVLASITMMIGAIGDYFGLPVEALAMTHPEIACPACWLVSQGNDDVIRQCADECQQEATRLGLLPAH